MDGGEGLEAEDVGVEDGVSIALHLLGDVDEEFLGRGQSAHEESSVHEGRHDDARDDYLAQVDHGQGEDGHAQRKTVERPGLGRGQGFGLRGWGSEGGGRGGGEVRVWISVLS